MWNSVEEKKLYVTRVKKKKKLALRQGFNPKTHWVRFFESRCCFLEKTFCLLRYALPIPLRHQTWSALPRSHLTLRSKNYSHAMSLGLNLWYFTLPISMTLPGIPYSVPLQKLICYRSTWLPLESYTHSSFISLSSELLKHNISYRSYLFAFLCCRHVTL